MELDQIMDPIVETVREEKPDVVVSWPRNCDYPLWRAFIRKERERFNKVIVVFTETNSGDDYREFVKFAMDKDRVLFLQNDVPTAGEDWRDLSVNLALRHVSSKWIWFTEQDFVITSKYTFWEKIYASMEIFDVIAISQQGRMHPACIFANRDAIIKTRCDFGIDPGKGDHFCKFQQDVERRISNYITIDDEEGIGYKHYNGLSHNWHLSTTGQDPNYRVSEFLDWIKMCVNLPENIEQDPRFLDHANRIISAYTTL